MMVSLCRRYDKNSFIWPTVESDPKVSALARPKVNRLFTPVAFKVVRPVYIKREGASEKHCPLP